MTHDEVMEAIKLNRTIGDYISVAVADGWSKDKVVTELYDLFIRTEGANYWGKISNLYDEYMSQYKIGGEVKPAPRSRGYKRKKPDPRAKAIEFEGKTYLSISEAAKVIGRTRGTIYQWIKSGQARYV